MRVRCCCPFLGEDETALDWYAKALRRYLQHEEAAKNRE